MWDNTLVFFTYLYRDKSGKRQYATIEAASREAAFAALKSRGILPLSLRAGGTGSSAKGTGRQASSHRLVAYVFASIAVIVAIAWWLCSYRTQDVPSPPDNSVAIGNKVNSRNRAGTAKTIKKEVVANKVDVRKTASRISKTNERPQTSSPKKEEVVFEGADLSSATNNTEENQPPKPLFSSGAEQLLALATPAVPGAMVPPLPYVSEESIKEDLQKAMRSVIRAEEGDTEETLERKLTVAAQKEEFRALQKEGMTFTEYLKAMREKNNDDAQLISDAHKVDEELYKDPNLSDEEYLKQREQINSTLRARGLPEMTEDHN